MARINLLPWRQEIRERKNKEFMTLLIAVLLLSLLGAFAAWSYFNRELEQQQQANESIKQANTDLDKALEKISTLEQQRNDIIERMKVIQDLQGRRPVPVHVWDDIARLVPAQMYLTNMKREGDVITFTGQADDPNVVSTFIRNLDGSQWLADSAVVSLSQPNAVAYQNQTARSTAPNNANGTGAEPRPEYPEDKYITFVVTTNITSAQSASTVASTAIATSSAASADTPASTASTAKE